MKWWLLGRPGHNGAVTLPGGPAHLPRPADVLRVELAEDERAAGQARRATREALNRWRRPGLVDAVVLAVSELLTNATRHGRPPVSMGLEHEHGRKLVRLKVHDASPTEPGERAHVADPDADSGRGLAIVQAVADEVTVEQVPDDGKVIHVTFGAPRGDAR